MLYSFCNFSGVPVILWRDSFIMWSIFEKINILRFFFVKHKKENILRLKLDYVRKSTCRTVLYLSKLSDLSAVSFPHTREISPLARQTIGSPLCSQREQNKFARRWLANRMPKDFNFGFNKFSVEVYLAPQLKSGNCGDWYPRAHVNGCKLWWINGASETSISNRPMLFKPYIRQ